MPPLRGAVRNELKQFRELSRLFFGRFLDNDLICIDGDTRATLAGILALLAAPGAFFPLIEYMGFSMLSGQPLYVRDLVSINDKLLYVSLSMTVLGIVTVIEWDTLLPDRRDYAVLRPLPIRLGMLFAAKIAALAGFWAVFTVMLNAAPAALFPIAVMQDGSFAMLAWFMRCHIAAIVAGNAFVFLLVIAVQGALMNLLGWRGYRRVSPYAQMMMVALLLIMFFASIGPFGAIHPARPAPAAAWLLPPVWFVGLYQNGLGWTQPVFRDLASHARLALALIALVAATAYALSYKRSVARTQEDADGPLAAPGRLTAALTALAHRVLLRDPAERASFHFVWHTTMRSRSHRALVAAYAGVGFAVVFPPLAAMTASNRASWQTPQGALVPVPLVLSLFLLAGLRYAFTVPAELRANWLFQAAGSSGPAQYIAGVRKAAILLGVVPLFALLLPVHIALWGWMSGCLHVLYGATLAYLLLELLLLKLDKIPFTCSYVPGKADVKSSWPLYLAGGVGYVSVFSGIEYLILVEPPRFLLFLASAALVKLGIELYRRRLLADEFALIYDERPEPAVRTLELQQ